VTRIDRLARSIGDLQDIVRAINTDKALGRPVYRALKDQREKSRLRLGSRVRRQAPEEYEVGAQMHRRFRNTYIRSRHLWQEANVLSAQRSKRLPRATSLS
jgi:hypothetical protein